MGIQLSTNFDLSSQIPLDSRAIVATTGERNALAENNKAYAGLIVYVTGENKYYYYNTGNSWAEFSTVGGGVPNLVYNTGDQTISGVKTFATGIVAPNLVYNTGDQTISGRKEFSGTVFSPFLTTRPSSIPKSPTFITLTDTSGNLTGTRHQIPFTNSSQDQEALSNFINSQSWVISGRTGFANPYNLLTPTLVNNTGVIDIPIASGTNFIYEFTTFTVENKFKKIERSGVFALLSGEKIGIGTLNPTEKAHIVGNLKLDGQLQTSLLPTVNGTGVLLSGEVVAQLPNTIVYNTGNQTISGVKTFASRPTVDGTGVLLSGEAVRSNGTVNSMIKLTQAQYNALSPVDSTTFYVIVG